MGTRGWHGGLFRCSPAPWLVAPIWVANGLRLAGRHPVVTPASWWPCRAGQLDSRHSSKRQRRRGRCQGQQRRGQRERGGGGSHNCRCTRPSCAAGPSSRWIRCTASVAAAARAGSGLAPVARTTSAVASDRGSLARSAASSACNSTSRHLCIRVPHQRQERQHLADDPGHGQQPVVTAGKVSSFMRQTASSWPASSARKAPVVTITIECLPETQ